MLEFKHKVEGIENELKSYRQVPTDIKQLQIIINNMRKTLQVIGVEDDQ